MEGILALIVIVIIFNLLSAIMRAIKGDKPVSRKPAAPGTERAREESFREPRFDEPVYYRSAVMKDTYAEEDDDSGEYDEITADTESVEKSGDRSELQPVVSPASKKTSRPSALQLRLQRVLTEKNSLVTAFVFHEIIGPPRSMRRK